VPETGFKQLAVLCGRLEETSKRKEKIILVSNFLKSLRSKEISSAVLLIVGIVFPEFDEHNLDLGWKTIQKIVKTKGQATLFRHEPTINNVQKTLFEIADQSGPGSRKIKEKLLEGLFMSLDNESTEILIRIIFGEMRIGVNEGIMLEAIAEASNTPSRIVRRALMVSGDLGKVAEIALRGGEKALLEMKATYFIPLKAMLAKIAESPEEIINEHGGETVFEYKYDGARIQIHRKENDVRIFNRRLSDVTESLPDIVELIKKNVPNGNFILEGEVVAMGENDKPLPFQNLMRRFTRVIEVNEMVEQIPLALHIFDILYLGKDLLIDEPYLKRWELLEELVPEDLLSKRMITDDPKGIKAFQQEALRGGHEGLMAKRLDSKYTPGSRGKAWFKLKTTESLDVVIKAADWGTGRRQGWLSNYHLSVWDGQDYLVIGKTFKGLTDEEFEWITQKLQLLKKTENSYTVYVHPRLVVEVEFNEIQKSPNYKSGFALRFARIKRIRDDKSPKNADTLNRVEELYEKQFKFKDKFNL
jgi:DNA ligase-1